MILKPMDILVNVNHRKDIFSRIKRWASGPYEHVFIFLGMVGMSKAGIEHPMIAGSIGRGFCLRSLSVRYGEEVQIMRIRPEVYDSDLVRSLFRASLELASNPRAYYDYAAILRFVLPRLVLQRLGIKLPGKWARDGRHICSESIQYLFERSGLSVVELLPGVIPLPEDFVNSSEILQPFVSLVLGPEVLK